MPKSKAQQASKAGQEHGAGVAKADKWVGPETDSIQAQRPDAAQPADETKEQAAGFLGQTEEQGMQGAADATRNRFGVGDDNNSSRRN